MKANRKKVCIQGLGFVGFAMAVAVANARDPKTRVPLYEVIGIDLAKSSFHIHGVNQAGYKVMSKKMSRQ